MWQARGAALDEALEMGAQLLSSNPVKLCALPGTRTWLSVLWRKALEGRDVFMK